MTSFLDRSLCFDSLAVNTYLKVQDVQDIHYVFEMLASLKGNMVDGISLYLPQFFPYQLRQKNHHWKCHGIWPKDGMPGIFCSQTSGEDGLDNLMDPEKQGLVRKSV